MQSKLHEKATALIGKALEMNPALVPKYFDNECGDDAELKALTFELYNNIMEDDAPKPEDSISEHQTKNFSRSRIFQNSSKLIERKKITKLIQTVFENRTYRLITLLSFFFIIVSAGILTRAYIIQEVFLAESNFKTTLIKTNKQLVSNWIQKELNQIQSIANLPAIKDYCTILDSLAEIDDSYELMLSSEAALAATKMILNVKEVIGARGISIINVENPKIMLHTSLVDSVSGVSKLSSWRLGEKAYLEYVKALENDTHFGAPMSSAEYLYNNQKSKIVDLWSHCYARVYSNKGKLVALICSNQSARRDFSKSFQISKHGESSETFAFNREGRMLTTSRFTDEIKGTSALKDSTITSVYNVRLVNPGKDITKDKDSNTDDKYLPYTSIVQDIFTHLDNKDAIYEGVHIKPFNDYRGVPVIGAWAWFPEYNFGIITKEDVSEILSELKYLDYILFVGSLIIFILGFFLYHSNVQIARFGKRIDDFTQLGQYHLKQKIGEGGFGEVYEAEHAFLKTPVAIKLLKKEFIGTDMLDRFQKEVKVTASLSNPNTIRVFDYGTSQSGQFYYVMEYLNGITLDKIVEQSSEMPVARVIHVLLQTCYSLSEAHTKGLVHRDVKPMNIMVCNQGGLYDTIKLLDFGLVKNVDTSITQQTQINRIGGTPMFMAPERLRDPFNADHRVDVYAIGTVGLYMLSGQFLLELVSQKMLSGQATLQGNFKQQLIERTDVPEELKVLLEECISFSVDKRPASVDAIIDKLEILKEEYPWTRKDAKVWWKEYDMYS